MEGLSHGTSPWSWSAEAIAAWSQTATLLIAFVAAIVGFKQIKANRNISREAEAQESFRDYLKIIIENKDVDVQSGGNQQQYHYLVVFMLTTFEKIYELSRADQHWLTTMTGHILWHCDYLNELRREHTQFFPSFNDDFVAFVFGVLDGNGRKTDDQAHH